MVRYSLNHIIVFTLTFASYAFLHATRKAFSNIKPTLIQEWTEGNYTNGTVYPYSIWNSRHLLSSEDNAKLFLGALDSMFMTSYAVGLYISGILGDKINLRLLLSSGMILSALSVCVFGVVTEWLHFYNIYFYGFIWILNGLFQSTGWPCAVAIMSNWFGNNRGLIFGIWSACASVGNIIGDGLVGPVVPYGYDFGLLLPCSILLSGGIFIFCGIISSPDDLKLNASIEKEPLLRETIQDDSQSNNLINDEPEDTSISITMANEPLSFINVILLPGVILYSLAYACLKLVNYAFFFWLPLYLNDKFHWSTSKADEISIWYDVGGIAGGILAGIISDKMWARSPVTLIMLLFAIPSLFLYGQCSGIIWQNSLMMGIMGFFIGGPANIISSAISADLGSQKCLAGNADALARVTGIVDGTGSIGAALGQILIPVIQKDWGWHYVFYIFMVMSGLTILCILPIFVKDVKRKLQSRIISATDL